jgi:hypothetical protein
MGEHVGVGELDIWTEQVGEGPDVLLIGGLGDTVESWELQLDGLADHYRLIAFDNRGAGRTAMPDGRLSAALTRPRFFGRSRLTPPTSPAFRWEAPSRKSWRFANRSSCAASSSSARTLARMLSGAPSSSSGAGFRRLRRTTGRSSRRFSPGCTRRAHADGTVEQIVEEALAFPHQQSVEAFQAQVEVCLEHDRGPPVPDRSADPGDGR